MRNNKQQRFCNICNKGEIHELVLFLYPDMTWEDSQNDDIHLYFTTDYYTSLHILNYNLYLPIAGPSDPANLSS